jgi:hypothetical protein
MTTATEVRTAAPEGQDGATLEAVIARSVLGGLGRPTDLHRVQVRRVFGGKYRVNVFVSADSCASGSTFRVAHSFFVEADEAGRVLHSSPPLARLY